jgi:lysophospholipase L1-like esterase
MHISSGTLIISGIVLLLAYLVFLAYPVYHSTHISQSLIQRAVPYEQHPSVPTMRILVVGDSTAVGVGTMDNHDSTAGRLGKQFPTADITNVAVSGYRLADVVAVLQKQHGTHYDLLLLQIGANDVTHFTPATSVAQQLSQILTVCSELSNKTILLTAGNIGLSHVFHWPLSAIITRRTRLVRSIFIKTVAQYPTVAYVDLFKNKKDDIFETDIARYYVADHFHLTDDGYGIWYQYIQKFL